MIEILSASLLLIGFLYIALLLYSLTKHRSGLSTLFSLLCLAIAIYVIGYGLEVHSSNIGQMMFFIRIEYFGVPFMTVFWLMFAYQFYFNKSPGSSLVILLMVVPVLTLFFCVTNDYHRLFYTNVDATVIEGHMIALLTKGFWYYIYVAYSYIASIIGILAFYVAWRKALYVMKEQAFLMLLGSVFPFLSSFVYQAGLSPHGIDLTPFGLSVSAIFFFIALFKYEFLSRGEIIRGTAFSETSEGIFFLDEKRRLIDFNNAAMKEFAWLDSKNIGIELSRLEGAGEISQQKHNHFELRIDREESARYYEFRVSDVREKKRFLGTVFYFRDITKLKELLKILDDMASYDALSQVYTRRRLMEEAEREAARASRQKGKVSVLMIDIDFFKQINDTFGHPAGDEAISEVAAVLRESVRRTDIVGRYGGEEFTVILSGSGLEDSLRIAELIRKKVEDLDIMIEGKVVKTTVSIGIAVASAEGEDIDIKKVIKSADEFLYLAKSKGRNRVCSELPY